MKRQKRDIFLPLLLGATITTCLPASQATEKASKKDNVLFKGTLVAEACSLSPEDASIEVDFGTMIDRYLYVNTRTPSKVFSIHLKDCDTTLSKALNISFSGNEDASLQGLLALDSGSEASGIAIGLETQEGKALPINQSNQYPLHDGDTIINLQAYVRGEPAAINNHDIGKGPFTVTTTFSIEYD